MKIKTFLLLGAAFVGGVAFAGAGYDSSLNLGTSTTAFCDTASSKTGGDWGSVITREDGYYVFEDDSVTNTFTATVATTSKYVTIEFDLKAAPVAEAPGAIAPDAQTAFCIYDNKFYGYGSGAWRELTGVAVPEDDADYKLRLSFDYHDSQKYVSFAVATGVEYTSLTATVSAVETNWLTTAANCEGLRSCAFAGCGSLKEFTCLAYDIASEAVIVPGTGKVDVPEDQVALIETAAGETPVAEFLASTASTEFPMITAAGVTVADAIALGLVAPNSDGSALEVKAPTIKVSGDALSTTEAVKINVNVAKPEGSNATIKYALQGATSAGGPFSDVYGYTDLDAVPTIPGSIIGTGSGKYLFFKVKVSVSYPAN